MCIKMTLHVYQNDLYRNDFVSKRPDTFEGDVHPEFCLKYSVVHCIDKSYSLVLVSGNAVRPGLPCLLYYIQIICGGTFP